MEYTEGVRFDSLGLSPEIARAIAQRQITPKFAGRFGLGAAPGEWDTLTRTLTARGFSKMELLDAGLAVAGKNGGIYDKFRSRLMLPVIDVRGDVVGFTSRLLPGLEGAKYLNSPDTVCFKKSQLIYALNFAKATKRLDRFFDQAEAYLGDAALSPPEPFDEPFDSDEEEDL